MVERGRGPRLLLEAAQVVRVVTGGGPDQFHGNIASQPFVARAKDLAHPSGTDFFEDPVVPHQLASHRCLPERTPCMAC